MKETKFTPGPWEAVRNGFVARAVKAASIWISYSCGEGISDEETEANALLVAASPDMYATLISASRELYDACHSSGDPDDETNMQTTAVVYREVRDALNKANP